MKTPIVDFVRRYADAMPLRLHMPGHKGAYFLGVEHMDITEIEGADVLYDAKGIIAQSQQYAAELFGSGATYYSCEGSSLAIRAMLYLVTLSSRERGEKAPVILAARNAHRTFVSAAALLDVDVRWMFPEPLESVLSCPVTPEQLDRTLSDMPERVAAVYITSPDYLGHVADVQSLAQVCHRHGTYLLVDNAHGAYLRFLPVSRHPLDLGADMCCDSAHKTLPVLTGGAYLHLSKTAPALWREHAMRALGLFASTSPSYLMLQSLDMANAYLSGTYPRDLAETVERTAGLKQELQGAGYALVGDEPLKLTVAPKSYGYTGYELDEYLQEKGIVCEFADQDHLVLMVSPQTPPSGLSELRHALLALPRRTENTTRPPRMRQPVRRLSLRQATLSPSRALPLEQCCGRVLALETVACPPAVPIVVCGERIDEDAIELMSYYGVKECRVVCDPTETKGEERTI